jgi:hypothetical protein
VPNKGILQDFDRLADLEIIKTENRGHNDVQTQSIS